MIAIGFDTVSGSIVISGNGVYGARTLSAAMSSGGQVRITSLAGRSELYVDWTEIANLAGASLGDPASALAYLQAEFAKGPAVGSPQRNYAVVVSDGQTVIPISPAPINVNSAVLIVNGVEYASPDIAASSLAIVWQGAFPLASTDAVRVTYF